MSRKPLSGAATFIGLATLVLAAAVYAPQSEGLAKISRKTSDVAPCSSTIQIPPPASGG